MLATYFLTQIILFEFPSRNRPNLVKSISNLISFPQINQQIIIKKKLHSTMHEPKASAMVKVEGESKS